MKRSLFSVCVVLACACIGLSVEADEGTPNNSGMPDPLPSWNDTARKQAVIKFVQEVCDEGSPRFVQAEDRIATFDNDGTLWCEKPLYIHLFANLQRFKEQVQAKPELENQQPYQAILGRDVAYFTDLLEQGKTDEIVSDVFGVPFQGLTTDQYAAWNRKFLSQWKHPRFNRGFAGLTYQPMVELVRFLQSNEFDIHIFTADEGSFLKLVAADLYDVPPSNVHGSSIKLEYEADGKESTLVRTATTEYFNNWDAKPRLIFQTLGKRPILAAGNSNGDLQMLQYVSQQSGPAMSLLIHHTDPEREYAYEKHTDKVMPMAKQLGWTIVDMKADWKQIFKSDADGSSVTPHF